MSTGAGPQPTMDVPTAVLTLATQVGSVEEKVNERVRHRELTASINSLRTDIGAKVDSSHSAMLDQMVKLIEASSSGRSAEIRTAVNEAIEDQRRREQEAREDFDRKMADAYRGARGMLLAQGGGVAIIVVVAGYFVAKAMGIEL